MSPQVARWFAGIIMAIAAFGLGQQFAASMQLTGSAAAALWAMLRYFTVITNLGVALVLGGIASGKLSFRSPFLIGGMTLSIVLVGVVYMTLLRGLVELSSGALLADTLLHKVVPIATLLFWLMLVPKGGIRWRDPFLWLLYPVSYLIYAVGRGQLDGQYPYPFIDLARIDWDTALVNSAGVALGFLAGGLLMVAVDHLLGQRCSSR
jgi:hypothetical protein